MVLLLAALMLTFVHVAIARVPSTWLVTAKLTCRGASMTTVSFQTVTPTYWGKFTLAAAEITD